LENSTTPNTENAEKPEIVQLEDPEYYVIIDNMKNTCCVDFISAAHVNCDFLVKFGDSCRADELNGNIPVMYVYGEKNSIDSDMILQRIGQLGTTGYVIFHKFSPDLPLILKEF
jgi:diphthamide biosynthesis enzyme Dph1/Dph2-like protein